MSKKKLLTLLGISTEAVAATATPLEARRWLEARAERDKDVARLLISAGAGLGVSSVFSTDRRQIVSATRDSVARVAGIDRGALPGDPGLAAVERVSLVGMLAWPLPDKQKPIGDSTRAEVGESLRYCRKMSGTFDLHARFLGHVFKLATDEKKPIKRQLTHSQLRDCYEKAEKAAS